MVDVSPCALRHAGAFSCGHMFWDETGGLTEQPMGPLVDTATMATMMNVNRVDSGRFGSTCSTFNRTHTSADSIRLLMSYQFYP